MISLVIVAVLMMTWGRISDIQDAEDRTKEAENTAKINLEYESYDRGAYPNGRMYGTDVISVVNKALNNNEKYLNESEYQITVEVNIQGDTFTDNSSGVPKTKSILDGLTKGKYIFTGEHLATYNSLVSDAQRFHDFKISRMFVVDRLEYNSSTGRVNKIIFQEKTEEAFRDGYMKAD